jgi:hypothetical protein
LYPYVHLECTYRRTTSPAVAESDAVGCHHRHAAHSVRV